MASFDTTYRNKASLAASQLYEGGSILIRNSSNVTLATLAIPTGAFANNGTGRAGLTAELTATVSTSGTAANYVINLSGGGQESGTVGTSSADMILDSVSLVQGGLARITVFNQTWPAST
jgi:hypothetical protein